MGIMYGYDERHVVWSCSKFMNRLRHTKDPVDDCVRYAIQEVADYAPDGDDVIDPIDDGVGAWLTWRCNNARTAMKGGCLRMGWQMFNQEMPASDLCRQLDLLEKQPSTSATWIPLEDIRNFMICFF